MVSAAYGSWNLFPTLGVQPVLGRSFTAEDDLHGANRPVILNWSLFKRRFNGDPSIVGKTIRLNAVPYTVVGVLPKWFSYPDPQVQLWVSVPARREPAKCGKPLQPHVSRDCAAQARRDNGFCRSPGRRFSLTSDAYN